MKTIEALTRLIGTNKENYKNMTAIFVEQSDGSIQLDEFCERKIALTKAYEIKGYNSIINLNETHGIVIRHNV